MVSGQWPVETFFVRICAALPGTLPFAWALVSSAATGTRTAGVRTRTECLRPSRNVLGGCLGINSAYKITTKHALPPWRLPLSAQSDSQAALTRPATIRTNSSARSAASRPVRGTAARGFWSSLRGAGRSCGTCGCGRRRRRSGSESCGLSAFTARARATSSRMLPAIAAWPPTAS